MNKERNAITKRSEYIKRCDLCHKYKQSRIFHSQINGKWVFLCKECWQKENEKLGLK